MQKIDWTLYDPILIANRHLSAPQLKEQFNIPYSLQSIIHHRDDIGAEWTGRRGRLPNRETAPKQFAIKPTHNYHTGNVFHGPAGWTPQPKDPPCLHCEYHTKKKIQSSNRNEKITRWECLSCEARIEWDRFTSGGDPPVHLGYSDWQNMADILQEALSEFA